MKYLRSLSYPYLKRISKCCRLKVARWYFKRRLHYVKKHNGEPIARPVGLIVGIVGVLLVLALGSALFLSYVGNKAKESQDEAIEASNFAAQFLLLCDSHPPQPMLPEVRELCSRATEIASNGTVTSTSVSLIPTVDQTVVSVSGAPSRGLIRIECLASGAWRFTYTDGTTDTWGQRCWTTLAPQIPSTVTTTARHTVYTTERITMIHESTASATESHTVLGTVTVPSTETVLVTTTETATTPGN